MNEYKFVPYRINGVYATAWVTGHVDEATVTQIHSMVNSPAFKGARMVVMPDAHYGKGCVVGTVIQFDTRISPSSLGVDLACGVDVYKVIGRGMGMWTVEEMNVAIRSAIPGGKNIRNSPLYSFSELDAVTRTARLDAAHRLALPAIGYEELAKKVGAPPKRVLYSIGTRGGGDHFIEVGKLTGGDYAFTIHSGSRNLGHRIATYWQKMAATARGMEIKAGRTTRIDHAKFLYNNGAISGEDLSGLIAKAKADFPAMAKGTEYLDGLQMQEYLRDVYMAQEYAELNRDVMAYEIARVLSVEIETYVKTTHNTVGNDGIARKGAVMAYVGMLVAISMNRIEGTWICKVTRSSEEHLWTLPHGAGREGSRKWAKSVTTQEEADAEMVDAGIYSSDNPRDEGIKSYKNPDKIYEAIKDRIMVVDVITPFLNIKDTARRRRG